MFFTHRRNYWRLPMFSIDEFCLLLVTLPSLMKSGMIKLLLLDFNGLSIYKAIVKCNTSTSRTYIFLVTELFTLDTTGKRNLANMCMRTLIRTFSVHNTRQGCALT